MSTIRQIRKRLKTETLEWTEVHVSADELDVQDLCDWAEYLGHSISPSSGYGYGVSMAEDRPKDYERQHMPFFAVLNADNPGRRKSWKITDFFNEMFPEIRKAADMEAAALRKIHKHALFLPISRTGTYCNRRDALDNPEKHGIPLYAATANDILRDPRGDQWKQERLAELKRAQEQHAVLMADAGNAKRQASLRRAAKAYAQALEMLAFSGDLHRAGYERVRVWRAAMRKRLGLKDRKPKAIGAPRKKAA
jgi:hypothetical protein